MEEEEMDPEEMALLQMTESMYQQRQGHENRQNVHPNVQTNAQRSLPSTSSNDESAQKRQRVGAAPHTQQHNTTSHGQQNAQETPAVRPSPQVAPQLRQSPSTIQNGRSEPSALSNGAPQHATMRTVQPSPDAGRLDSRAGQLQRVAHQQNNQQQPRQGQSHPNQQQQQQQQQQQHQTPQNQRQDAQPLQQQPPTQVQQHQPHRPPEQQHQQQHHHHQRQQQYQQQQQQQQHQQRQQQQQQQQQRQQQQPQPHQPHPPQQPHQPHPQQPHHPHPHQAAHQHQFPQTQQLHHGNASSSGEGGSSRSAVLAADAGPPAVRAVPAGGSMLGANHPLPDIAAFQAYQQLVTQILDRSDCEFMGGKRMIKRSGWRKLALAFNVSFEARSEQLERDEGGNVVYARFVQRAIMPDGRFADGWGACDHREKRFAKPNHDVPATAETRAKNRACADLFGIGESKR